MRIAFDSQAFCLQRTGGISRYFCRLAAELALRNETVGVFAPLYRNSYLAALPKSLVHGYSVKNYLPKTANLMVRANAQVAARAMQRWCPELVHETYFSARPALRGKHPTVLTVFDMISELPELSASNSVLLQGSVKFSLPDPVKFLLQDPVKFSLKDPVKFSLKDSVKYQAIQRADHVICISEATRVDLIRLFGVAPDKISVVHLGCEVFNESPSLKQNSDHSRPYLLYVGLRDGYKNFNGFLCAVASSHRLLREFDVLAFGGGAFTHAEKVLMRELGFSSTQVQHRSGDDASLSRAYRHATAFVYPSLYEGFGLPPLEAMAQSCPVVSSNTSSMPEVIGSAAEYFDPTDLDQLSSAIEKVVFDADRRAELIDLGRQRVADFTWAQCAKKTVEVYRALCPSPVRDAPNGRGWVTR